jgi:hypothetical protein
VHVTAAWVVAVLAVAVVGLTVDWLSGPPSVLQISVAFAWLGVVAMGAVVVDVVRNRDV